MKLSSEFIFLCSTLPIILVAAQSCGFTSIPEINATDIIKLTNPFQTPSGLPSRAAESSSDTWRWTLATVSADEPTQNTAVENRLWLNTEPAIDLTEPTFGYLGCGAVIHGLKHDAIVNGQADSGNCSTVFDAACLSALLENAQVQAEYINEGTWFDEPRDSALSYQTAYGHCKDLGWLHGANNAGLPPECSNFLESDAWAETFGELSPLACAYVQLTSSVFASPQTRTICPGNPSTGSVSHPLFAWGDGQYSSTNLTAYNQSVTAVTPILLAVMANASVETSISTQRYTEQHLLCFRPKKFEHESVHPTAVPNAAAVNSLSFVRAGVGSLLLAMVLS